MSLTTHNIHIPRDDDEDGEVTFEGRTVYFGHGLVTTSIDVDEGAEVTWFLHGAEQRERLATAFEEVAVSLRIGGRKAGGGVVGVPV